MQFEIILLVFAIVKFEGCDALTLAPQVGPVGSLEVTSVSVCNYKNTLKTSVYLDLTKKGKEKFVFGNFTIAFDFDESIKFKINMHKWTGSEWKKDVYKMEGPLCTSAKKYIGTVWKKVFSTCSSPKLAGSCGIKKGSYDIVKCQVSSKDVKLPSVFYGKLKLDVKLFKGNDQILCVIGEADSKPPAHLL